MENKITYKQIREAIELNIVHRDARILIATNNYMYNVVFEYDNANATISKDLNSNNLGNIVLKRDAEVEKEEELLDKNLSIINLNANKFQKLADMLLLMEVANDITKNNIDIVSIQADAKANNFDPTVIIDDALKSSNIENLAHIDQFRREFIAWYNQIKSEYKIDIQEIKDDAEDIARAKVKYDEIIKNAEETEVNIQRGYEILAKL